MPPKDSIPELSVLEMLEARIAPASVSGGSDMVASLYVDGVSVGAGVWGTIGGGATYESDHVTGTGTLIPPWAGNPEKISASKFHFRDADGDEVTVKFSKKILGDAKFRDVFHFSESGVGYVLDSIDFSKLADPKKARGVSIEITVDKSSVHADSDGIVEVGAILSQGSDLGRVSIEGSLGRIVAGDGKGSGLKSLSVQTLGSEEALTASDMRSFASSVWGSLGEVQVQEDILGASLWVHGKHANLGNLDVGGSLVGGVGDMSGCFVVDGRVGSAAFGGDVRGGAGEHSGKLHSDGKIRDLTVTGAVSGGSGDASGRIESLAKISKSVVGLSISGTGDYSGKVNAGFDGGNLARHYYGEDRSICACMTDGIPAQFLSPWGEVIRRIDQNWSLPPINVQAVG